jgi:tRNA nucleotidyltransferase (CCA-adding enzyme)
MANVRAYDIMSKDVLTVTPDMSKDEARRMLFQSGVHGVPVVDHSGRLVGMVSVVDLAGKLGTRVLHIMEHNPITAPEDATAGEIASLMLTRNVRRVPILREGRLVGIVGASDIIRALLDLLEERAAPAPVETEKV